MKNVLRMMRYKGNKTGEARWVGGEGESIHKCQPFIILLSHRNAFDVV